ncbi:MAG: UDP-N-acetylmuramoyl-tripeptide--D-alanyl-D-alanine ligase [Acetobacteraceae bacterium]
MSLLWTPAELAAATGASPPPAGASGVSIDSRTLEPGDLFVALRAERDGHGFVADALAKGAAVAMVDHVPEGVRPGAPLLVVPDTLAGLAALGRAARARSRAGFVAVTGSVGKTTVKEMLRHGLSAIGPAHASVASYNNQWGVPLTLARTPRDARFAVIEIGMNARGEIAPLARMAAPHVAVITAVAAVHLGPLGSLEAIAEEKGDILEGALPGGVAVLPQDSPFFPRLAARAEARGLRVVGFGERPGAAARLRDVVLGAESVSAMVELSGAHLPLRLEAPGRHMALNATAAIAAGSALGADPGRVAAALAFFRPVEGRGRRVPIRVTGGEALLLDESYNCSPVALRAALAVLAAAPAKRRIAVIGDMLELGDAGPALHAEAARDAAEAADLVFTCGPLTRLLHEALPERKRGAHVADSALLAALLPPLLRAGDAVLVKGSLGMRMSRVVQALKEAAR